MLRSKYKAEDYLTSEKNAEKKKVSQVGFRFFMSALCNLFTEVIFLGGRNISHLTPFFRLHNTHLNSLPTYTILSVPKNYLKCGV